MSEHYYTYKRKTLNCETHFFKVSENMNECHNI